MYAISNWLFTVCCLAPSLLVSAVTPPDESTKKVGVGIVAHPLETGDEVEKAMYTWMGQTPQIEHIFIPDNPQHLFELLRKVGMNNKQIKFLVLAGHGSAQTPSINLHRDVLWPTDVDPVYLKQQLKLYQKILKARQAKNRDTRRAQKEVDTYKRKLQDLESLSEVMAENATVILVNCSTARTDAGRQFVQNFGNALLSKRGGTIIASREDVAVEQIDSRLELLNRMLFNWEYPTPGDILVAGDWQHFPIAAKTAEAARCPDIAGAWVGELYVKEVSGSTNIRTGQKRRASFAITQDQCNLVLKFGNNEISGDFKPGETAAPDVGERLQRAEALLSKSPTGALTKAELVIYGSDSGALKGKMEVTIEQRSANGALIVSGGRLSRE